MSVSLDGVDVLVNTTECPLVLKDRRVFSGVFRVACPDARHSKSRLAASFRGTIIMPQLFTRPSARIHTLNDYDHARCPAASALSRSTHTASVARITARVAAI